MDVVAVKCEKVLILISMLFACCKLASFYFSFRFGDLVTVIQTLVVGMVLFSP